MSDQLFSLAGIATLGWLLLIFLPGWRVTRRLADLEIFPIYLALLYLVGVVPLLIASGPGIMRDFGNADGVAKLLARREVALIAWIHILAFDQVVGVLIYRDNMRERYVPVVAQSLILCFTFMFGPVGYLLYAGVRAIRRPRTGEARVTGVSESAGVADIPPRPPERVTPRSALRLLWAAWAKEPAVSAAGALGVALGIILLAAIALRGRMVFPEGDLMKAASFDAAVGIYGLTLVVFFAAAPFSERGRRRWRAWQLGLVLGSYGLETIQIARGIDPRFTQHGSIADKLGGPLFLLMATGVLVLFLIVMIKSLKNRTGAAAGPMMLALRYGFGIAMIGFLVGYLMSGVAGSRYGAEGNTLPLHAMGFHGLQAIPLVALFFIWAGVSDSSAERWIHVAGLAWLGACVAVAWQMFAGRAVLAPSPATFATVVLLLVWAVAAGRGAYAWHLASRLPSSAATRNPVLARN